MRSGCEGMLLLGKMRGKDNQLEQDGVHCVWFVTSRTHLALNKINHFKEPFSK